MMDRRALLKSSLLTCSTAAASSVFGKWFPRIAIAGGSNSSGPFVQTSLGKLRGAFSNGVYAFKGIHYGASTEGMRFQPPTPPKPWTGVRDALELGAPAPQDVDWDPPITNIFGRIAGPGTMSEDCLVLNVWTAGLSGQVKQPVMVWLHGGGYTIGSAGIPVYDGINLAARNNIVVVGINHRLNVFGHLYLAGFEEKYADSGNVGMLDIVLALHWVRDNIAHFGGDPGNVTIFGESGGGYKVSTLMAMPAAKGLFQKAIVESGSQLRATSSEEAGGVTRKFLAQLHLQPDRVDHLRKIPMDQLIAAAHSMGEDPWGPVLDGRSLPRHPFDPDAPATTKDVPMLIGTNADETRLGFGINEPSIFSLNEADLRSKLKSFLSLTDDSKLEMLITTYRKNRPESTPGDIYFAVTTDGVFRMDAITQAERKVAQHAAPVYMYMFAWPTPILGGKLKAMHAAELAFVFDNVDKVPTWVGTGSNLQPLASKISSTWATFARTGNPNHAGLPSWPVYDTSTRATMILNNECRVVNDPGKEERLALASLAHG